jgi:hypothetical protein
MDGSMYLVLPVPFHSVDGRLYVEAQAANGLDRWADYFAQVKVAAPVIPETLLSSLSGFVWRPVDTLENGSRIECQALPWAYSPKEFLREYKRTRKLIAASIAASQHLQFAIGGLIGDWAALAAIEAVRQRRRYAIHTDRVEHEVVLKTASSASALRRVKIALEAPAMKRYHRYVIERCSLGLWHGDDCYRAYSPWCRQSHLIHDIHTKQTDLIGAVALAGKVEEVRSGATLKLCYAGRLDPMKAPLEWLAAIATARDRGAKLQATWYGEGTMLAEALAERSRLGLDDVVEFGGFVADRATMLAHLRAAHALVFTHVTPESPRILLESLVSGTPIVGYDNAYAVNLLEATGGGARVKLHDTEALGALIASLAEDRERLAAITLDAATTGSHFTDAAVFSERSELLKQFA